jgi:hypothetical protein
MAASSTDKSKSCPLEKQFGPASCKAMAWGEAHGPYCMLWTSTSLVLAKDTESFEPTLLARNESNYSYSFGSMKKRATHASHSLIQSAASFRPPFLCLARVVVDCFSLYYRLYYV